MLSGTCVDLGAVQLPGEKSQQLPWAAWAALLMKGGPYMGGTGVGRSVTSGSLDVETRMVGSELTIFSNIYLKCVPVIYFIMLNSNLLCILIYL